MMDVYTNEKVRAYINEWRGKTISALTFAHPNERGLGTRCSFVVAENDDLFKGAGRGEGCGFGDGAWVWMEISAQKNYGVEDAVFAGDMVSVACVPVSKLMPVLHGRKRGINYVKQTDEEHGFFTRKEMGRDSHEYMSTFVKCYRLPADGEYPGEYPGSCHIATCLRYDDYRGAFRPTEIIQGWIILTEDETRAVAKWLKDTISHAKCA